MVRIASHCLAFYGHELTRIGGAAEGATPPATPKKPRATPKTTPKATPTKGRGKKGKTASEAAHRAAEDVKGLEFEHDFEFEGAVKEEELEDDLI